MKNFKLFQKQWMIIPLSLFFLCSNLNAQNQTPLYIVVKTSNGELSPQTNPALNQVFQNYNLTDSYLTYPGTITKELEKFYSLEIADAAKYTNFAADLQQLSLFNDIEVIYPQSVMECTDPNNTEVSYNDPELAANTDYIELMNLPCAWTITKGSAQFPVAIVDQFMDFSHFDLEGKVVIENPNNCNPLLAGDAHGYIITGCVAAIPDNGICTAGTGHDTQVGFYCAGGTIGSGSPSDRVWDAFLAGYKIINASYGGSPHGSTAAVTEMLGRGVVITHGTAHNYVANTRNIPGFILAGRVDNNNNYVPYNPFNNVPPATNATEGDIDILVPSENLPRLVPFNTCGVPPGGGLAGNSGAGPLVAGVVALMRSVNPCLSPGEIEEIVRVSHQGLPANADNPGDPYFGIITAGILDAELAVTNARDYVWTDEEISTNTTISDPKMVTGNLVIKTGTEVTITSTVSFNTDSKLIVERGARLIVDGGTLTVNTCCGSEWRGVFVEGNSNKVQSSPFVSMSSLAANDSGILRLINGATIEYAKNAVSTNNSHQGWPAQADYYGGIIHANDANFLNCNRAAQFMRYGVGNLRDKSKFIDCDFTNLHSAVTIWANNGVTFERNEFSEIKNRAIQAYDAEVIVRDGNIFDLGTEIVDIYPMGIEVFSTHPSVFGSTIGSGAFPPNEFIGGSHAIHLTASSNADKLRIENNTFTDCVYGVHIQNEAHYEISHNIFENHNHAIRVVETGGYENIQSWNDITDCDIGTYVWHSNEGFIFANNCFDDNGITDIAIVGESAQPNFPGTVAPFQGENGGPPAGNTFSKTTDAIIITGGDAGDVNPFTYYIPQNTPTSSDLHPTPNDDPFNMLTIAFTNGALTSGTCGLQGPMPPEPPVVCDVPALMADIKQDITSLETSINQNPNNSEMDKICLKKLKLALIHRYAFNDDESGMYTYFETEADFNIKATMYGYSVEKGNYVAAEGYLDSLAIAVVGPQPNLTSEQSDFIAVQKINLKRLTQGEQFNITPTEKSLVLNIAEKGRPMDGYARGLWLALFDEPLPIELPEVRSRTQGQQISNSSNVSRIKAGPNPVQNSFSIDLPENKMTTQIVIWNLQGQQILDDKIQENSLSYQFNTSTFQSGIYFLTLTNAEGTYYQTKFIKL